VTAVARWDIDVPIVVLSHDPVRAVTAGAESVEGQRLWSEGQREYARLVRRGIQEDVPNSTHYIQRDDPNRVALAIRTVLRTVR
jgi:hypothetical protein